MKIALMTGSYPPDICGAADYTARLEESLKQAGNDVTICTGMPWGLFHAGNVSRQVSALGVDVLHIQYPVTGYGPKLGPQLLSLLQPFVVTIHECSQAHILRRLSLYPFSLRAKKIIFTNEFELKYASRFAPWIKSRSVVIPIGNNVALAEKVAHPSRKVITCFGLIRPDKGLEEVIELARVLHQEQSSVVVRVVGTVFPGNEAYLASLKERAAGLAVEWVLGLDDRDLSRTLAETEIAYLPFVDGASERRSSLIAMLSNRAAVITTRGLHTPAAMEGSVLFAGSPREAATHVATLIRKDDFRNALQSKGAAYAEKFSWEKIAAEHMAIYREVLSGTL
jgi:glycosyltransferase involved in cell wall biosynthesis